MMGLREAGSPEASSAGPSTLLLMKGGVAAVREPLPTLRSAFGGHAPCRLSLPQIGGSFFSSHFGLCRTVSISGLPCLAAIRQPLFPWVVLSTAGKPPKPKG